MTRDTPFCPGCGRAQRNRGVRAPECHHCGYESPADGAGWPTVARLLDGDDSLGGASWSDVDLCAVARVVAAVVRREATP